MTTATLTTAGLMAPASVARVRVASPAECAGTTLPAAYGVPVVHQGSAHPLSTWTQGAIAKSATFMAFTGKNRPTRPLSELSP